MTQKTLWQHHYHITILGGEYDDDINRYLNPHLIANLYRMNYE